MDTKASALPAGDPAVLAGDNAPQTGLGPFRSTCVVARDADFGELVGTGNFGEERQMSLLLGIIVFAALLAIAVYGYYQESQRTFPKASSSAYTPSAPPASESKNEAAS
jgi:hypothetical protein